MLCGEGLRTRQFISNIAPILLHNYSFFAPFSLLFRSD